MAVDEPNEIDIFTQAPDGKVFLIISDHLEWDDSLEHQQILQDKLNSYLRFFESGEIYTRFPSAKGQWPVIEIVFQHEPDAGGRAFLADAAKVIESAGLTLTHRVFAESYKN
jgi:hypothetical protein